MFPILFYVFNGPKPMFIGSGKEVNQKDCQVFQATQFKR